ncbi:MAG TPA: MBOAT family protein [Pirellulales bacterium]|nr:MBOAT family protein [Pirellulales bacterium]
MLFCSERFLVFFTIVFTLYWALRWHSARIYLLLAASFYFYASWNSWLALIIGVSTTIDYFVARGMDATDRPSRRKLLLSITVVANLSLLCYFKYANFFLHSLEEAMRAAGSTASLPMLKVILPIGISFYTFEAINYAVDVYRRHVPAERNLAHFMLFITFFPHLVAGPIVRARDFLPQIRQRKHWDWARLQLGAQFFLMGLFKKLAIADRMAMFSDPVFANPEQYRTSAVWLAVLAYALQIYCDFSGYTDMALGTAHMLGFKLARNFNMPYVAANVSEFWHRWHISLSSWLRDYLFIPLGGSRGTAWQTNRNLLITMTLGGLWHGASWTFVVWGVLHGLLLVGHRSFREFCRRRPRLDALLLSPPGTAGRVALTFFTVCMAWVFFRATTFAGAATVFRHMFAAHQGLSLPMHKESLLVLATVVFACHLAGLAGLWQKLSVRLPAPLVGMSYALLLTVTLVLAPDAGKAFIYFQF